MGGFGWIYSRGGGVNALTAVSNTYLVTSPKRGFHVSFVVRHGFGQFVQCCVHTVAE